VDSAIPPTAVVGMAGALPDVALAVDAAFQAEGDRVLLLGSRAVGFGGSEYAAVDHGRTGGPSPLLDFAAEARLQRCCRELIWDGRLRSAHDCAEGGLAVAVAECALLGGHGFRAYERWKTTLAAADLADRADLLLFGEGPSRIVVSCRPEDESAVTRLATEAGIDVIPLGEVAGDHLTWPGAIHLPLAQAQVRWDTALDN
jgi:phosphoribosylformylglycinamidine synthase